MMGNYDAFTLISFSRNMATSQYAIAPLIEQEQDTQEEMVYCHDSAKLSDKKINDDFIFPIDVNDVLFTLTLNPSVYKENVSNLISKMLVINELSYINLNELSKILAAMHIKELNIFSIDDNLLEAKVVRRDNGSLISYTEITREQFITILNSNALFSDYNRFSLYILRDAGFLDIKNLFAKVNGHEMNLGRGGGQKAHVLSPLDFRLSSYVMAMFNFNYGLISKLNAFNGLDKDRYLSYLDKTPRSNDKYYKPYKQYKV
jgi:hypothetical protein